MRLSGSQHFYWKIKTTNSSTEWLKQLKLVKIYIKVSSQVLLFLLCIHIHSTFQTKIHWNKVKKRSSIDLMLPDSKNCKILNFNNLNVLKGNFSFVVFFISNKTGELRKNLIPENCCISGQLTDQLWYVFFTMLFDCYLLFFNFHFFLILYWNVYYILWI